MPSKLAGGDDTEHLLNADNLETGSDSVLENVSSTISIVFSLRVGMMHNFYASNHVRNHIKSIPSDPAIDCILIIGMLFVTNLNEDNRYTMSK